MGIHKYIRIVCVLGVITLICNFMYPLVISKVKLHKSVAEIKLASFEVANDAIRVMRRYVALDAAHNNSNLSNNSINLDSVVMTSNSSVNQSNRQVQATRENMTTDPLLVLITTWPFDRSKEEMHNITILNWWSFRPKVRIVVFVNDSQIVTYVNALGIRTFPVLHHAAGGAPVLRSMVETTKAAYPRSTLYGFANADILFTDSLINTLEREIYLNKERKPMLLVGQRTNVMNIKMNETKSYQNITQIAKSRGKLFDTFAEDYFITNQEYPWQNITDVVVGRRAYDNWLVYHSICRLNVHVVDVTNTLLAVHQTTLKGNFEGHKAPNTMYNDKLLGTVYGRIRYIKGYTRCTRQYTVWKNKTIEELNRKGCGC